LLTSFFLIYSTRFSCDTKWQQNKKSHCYHKMHSFALLDTRKNGIYNKEEKNCMKICWRWSEWVGFVGGWISGGISKNLIIFNKIWGMGGGFLNTIGYIQGLIIFLSPPHAKSALKFNKQVQKLNKLKNIHKETVFCERFLSFSFFSARLLVLLYALVSVVGDGGVVADDRSHLFD